MHRVALDERQQDAGIADLPGSPVEQVAVKDDENFSEFYAATIAAM